MTMFEKTVGQQNNILFLHIDFEIQSFNFFKYKIGDFLFCKLQQEYKQEFLNVYF